MSRKIYLAADIGAGSGRVLAGTLESGKISLEEICRFSNQPMEVDGSLRWDIEGVFQEILGGIKIAIDRYGADVKSIGIDTWGVDYGLLDGSGKLLDTPYCYRDDRTEGMIARADEIVPQSARYAQAGIQQMHFNTLYQLLAEKLLCSSDGCVQTLLFIPDLINYWLCGVKANEVTIASTSELLNAKSGEWSDALISKNGLPRKIFQELVEPGERLGVLSDRVSEEVGSNGIFVVATPSHDTAAAVAACPLSETKDSIYISSGTWSLMGVEEDHCFTDSVANAMGLTNERGVEGTTRLLKNISGFWIFQQCKLDWNQKGFDWGYDELREMAIKSAPFQAYLDPNDACFEKPGEMVSRIEAYFQRTGQQVAMDPGLICRTIFEGLALSYRAVKERLERATHKQYETIRIIGGGSQNAFLNQLAADATGCQVIAGPLESSSLGNILAQLKADGEIARIREGRSIIENSFEMSVFEPTGEADWASAYKTFKQVTNES